MDRIPEKIVDFLNSLKTFLDIRGCIFVLGCDYNILESALKNKYEGEMEIYEDYFDKIVQTEFYIPKISEQAIKNYLQFLTDWNDKEIEECTQLVIHSISGNPRKIKRVVNATMLIKSVFERRLATFLQAFEKPEPKIRIERMGEGKAGELEEPMALKREISMIFTPAEVFDLLFDKRVLFKLMCLREQWFTCYKNIISDEKKQEVLISLQDSDIITDMSELFSTTKEQGEKLKGNVENLNIFIHDFPRFQEVEDLKTYLTLLEISSPKADISLAYPKPQELPINLFNRYMMFERINKGKVDERIIEEKINQMDWESSLNSYLFFIDVISAFGYDNLLKGLFEKNLVQIAEKIRTSTDLTAIGRLLGSVSKNTARGLLNETKDTYAKKIIASTNPTAIGVLLNSVNLVIDEEIARGLLNETKDTYAEKIVASTDTGAIGNLLLSVRLIDENTARELLNETKDTYAEKMKASTNLFAIGWLLNRVKEVDENTVRSLLNKTKNMYAEKIRASTDPSAIGWLLDRVNLIDKKTARWLERETKFKSKEK